MERITRTITMAKYLSENFQWSEFETTTYQDLKIANMIPSFEVASAVKAFVKNVLQPLRTAWGKPIHINSGYRCEELNKRVGGSATSQHRKGEAADLRADNPLEFARFFLSLGLPYDQIGIYGSFIHISYKCNGSNRGMIFYDKSYKGEKLL